MDNETLKIIAGLRNELDAELGKKFGKRDFERIEKLTQSIRELTESKEDIDRRTQNGIVILKEKINQNNTVKISNKKIVAGLCTCFAVIIVLNCISFSAWGTNIFSAVIGFNKDSILIDFSQKPHNNTINLPKSSDDPYGIKGRCAEYGMFPETPEYIPENFSLVNIDTDELKICKDISFYYKSGKKKINFTWSEFYIDDIPPVGIPADTHNFTEQTINNNTVYILKEDNQFTATYIIDNTVYFMYTDNVDYDECEKILESFR